MTLDSEPSLNSSLDLYVKAALGRKAYNLVVLDVRELTSIADVFIICSGRSNRQVAAIAEFIQVDLKKNGIKPLIKAITAIFFLFFLISPVSVSIPVRSIKKAIPKKPIKEIVSLDST